MNVKRFFGANSREALRRVKEELGGDALVLSNRSVEGGVEIMAASAATIASLPQPAPRIATSATPPLDGDADFTVSLSTAGRHRSQSKKAQQDGEPDWKPIAPRGIVGAVAERVASAFGRSASEIKPFPVQSPVMVESAPQPLAAPLQALASAAGAINATTSPQLMHELQAIKGLIEQQLAGFAWGDLSRAAPVKTLLLSDMLEAGFSAQLARTVVDMLPAQLDAGAARKQVCASLGNSLRTLDDDADLIDRGGVYALVGPTGVGKTTTTAKLAARCVMRHGAAKLALLTTDNYRIGAHEQLRIYGRILGVAVHAVGDAADLKQALAELRNKHIVLIDTAGVGQRDRMVAEQAAMLLAAGNVRRLLLLNATCRGDTLDDVVRAYKNSDLAGCIITKTDEAVSLAPTLDALIRHRLMCFYVANGQRVPEDLHLPNRAYLLHRALKTPAETSPHHLQGDEAGLLLAAAHGANVSATAAGMAAAMNYA